MIFKYSRQDGLITSIDSGQRTQPQCRHNWSLHWTNFIYL